MKKFFKLLVLFAIIVFIIIQQVCWAFSGNYNFGCFAWLAVNVMFIVFLVQYFNGNFDNEKA